MMFTGYFSSRSDNLLVTRTPVLTSLSTVDLAMIDTPNPLLMAVFTESIDPSDTLRLSGISFSAKRFSR
jgi:hypothetical protein